MEKHIHIDIYPYIFKYIIIVLHSLMWVAHPHAGGDVRCVGTAKSPNPSKLGTYTAHVGDEAGAESTSCDQAAHFSISDSGQAGEMRVWPGVRLARGHPGRLMFGFPSGIIR